MDVQESHKLPLSLFDYALPDAAIAQVPIEPRDASRMMVLAGPSAPHDGHFLELPDFLEAGDLLLINRTEVVPARLRALRPSGAPVELLLHTPLNGPIEQATRFRALAKPAKPLRPGVRVRLAHGAELEVVARHGGDVDIQGESPLLRLMEGFGEMPLPPYLKRSVEPQQQDRQRYQSVMARDKGAVAAPTASLHFTPQTFAALKARQVLLADVVLHVGPGTFLPVRPDCAEDVRQHVMHKESYAVPSETLAAIKQVRRSGKKVIAVGTTALRAVETWAASGQATGESQLFIYPGYRCRAVDGLLTNFHLPKSTLLMLVSALVGRDRLMAAYQQAVALGYRFFSYGDAMLILP